MSAARGRFIAFEGGEGAGKSTQTRLLAEALRARGLRVVTTREPGGTPGAEAIRDLLLAPPGDKGWTPQAEALLFAAARADHVANLIRPALGRGEWVLCDRFLDSSRAYQGRAGDLGDEAILALHAFGSGSLRPDRVILLEGDEAALTARLAARGAETDAIEARPASYHRAVAAAFRAFAEADPAGFVRIDGIGDPTEVHGRIMAALADLLEKGVSA